MDIVCSFNFNRKFFCFILSSTILRVCIPIQTSDLDSLINCIAVHPTEFLMVNGEPLLTSILMALGLRLIRAQCSGVFLCTSSCMDIEAPSDIRSLVGSSPNVLNELHMRAVMPFLSRKLTSTPLAIRYAAIAVKPK